MSQMKNVHKSSKGSKAASPEVGAPTRPYGKGQNRNNLTPPKAGQKGKY